MNYQFSDRIGSLKPSAIREILKSAGTPGLISLAAGSPASETLPNEFLADTAARLLRERPADCLQYSITAGHTPLRELVRTQILAAKGIGTDADSVIITSGAQQCMELAVKALCNEGDTILCEDPSFIGSLNAFRSYGVNLVGIPMQPDGMDLDKLEAHLKQDTRVKILYLIPNFQNPTGRVTSLQKRKAVLALAEQYNFIIIEDDPYGDTRFAGEPVPAIKSMDQNGRVVYAGSFSKVIAPGLRVGYCCANAEIIGKMTVCKQVSDVHTCIFSQLLAYEFLTKADFAAHLANLQSVYRRKAGIMCDILENELPSAVSFERVQGGLFVWCRFPKTVDTNEFCKMLIDQKVAGVPGAAFVTDESKPSDGVRLNFSFPADDALAKGTEIFCRTARNLLG